ncbi:MAG TPA: asparagine synthase (glutamine-hydrolyzing) [Polyangiaceae bacterium]|nr:asparagine synthase (glutamine-hydrolyzing) [Polyangiaceae bacterium]
MCGISGIIGSDPGALGTVERMTDVILHRGPDGYGYYEGKGVVFGHRRLAVVDLSEAGHQPMTYLDRYVITYNGEVYNHVELRRRLELHGYRFHSKTDTEVILAAYDKWGEAAVREFNGMWAFAIHDRQTGKVFCSRDRFGIKPFYYWVAPDGSLCFGSEIKQFAAHPAWRARINPQRAYDFLVWGLSNHTDETLFKDVYQLDAGCSLAFSVDAVPLERNGRLRVKRWYRLAPKSFDGDFEQAVSEFRSLLVDSVTLQLQADVAVGSCLSGGLDSSSIVCIVSDLLKGGGAAQKTFSACSKVERYDEKKWADHVIRSTGVSAHFVYPDLNELFSQLSEMTWHQDEPFNATGVYAQWNVFALAAQNGITVMLDGQGADEYLAGYHDFIPANQAGLLRSGQWRRLCMEISAAKRVHGYSELHSLLQLSKLLLPRGLRAPLARWAGTSNGAPDWLDLGALSAVATNPLDDVGYYTGSLQAMCMTQLTRTHVPTLVHWEDRNSMAHSIESRVPFLDHRLVEFTLGLPDDHKIQKGQTKRVLRSGMTGILPDSVRARVDKQGFITPEEVWMRDGNPELFRRKLDDSIAASRGILKGSCRSALDGVISGRQPYSSKIWRLINFGEWMKTFEVAL